MATITQAPAEVNIIVAVDDSFSSAIDFDISLVGKTIEGKVETGRGSTAFTIAQTDLSSGQITISLTSAEIQSIGVGSHRWYLRYYDGSMSRRAFAGTFTVVRYNA